MFEKSPIPRENPENPNEIPSEIKEFISREKDALREVQTTGSKKAKMMAAAFLAMSITLGAALPSLSAEKAPEKSPVVSESSETSRKTANTIGAAQRQWLEEQEKKERKILEKLKDFSFSFLRGLENLTSKKQKVPTSLRERIVRKYIEDQYNEYKQLQGKIGQSFYGSQEEIMATFLNEVAGSENMENFLKQTKGKKNYFERSGEFLDDEDVRTLRNIKKGYDEKK